MIVVRIVRERAVPRKVNIEEEFPVCVRHRDRLPDYVLARDLLVFFELREKSFHALTGGDEQFAVLHGLLYDGIRR